MVSGGSRILTRDVRIIILHPLFLFPSLSSFLPCPFILHFPFPAQTQLWGLEERCNQYRWRSHKAWLDIGLSLLLSIPLISFPFSPPILLVHFKHYFNRERIENQISNSKIGVSIYNRTYRVLHRPIIRSICLYRI